MRKRNKKYNPAKTITAEARRYSKDKAVIFTLAGDKKSSLISLRTLDEVNADLSRCMMISDSHLNWHVTLVVFGRDVAGNNILRFDTAKAPYLCKQEWLTESLNSAHVELLDEFNGKHIDCFVNVGWLATTMEYEFTEGQIVEAFDKFGAWDYLAKWEIEND